MILVKLRMDFLDSITKEAKIDNMSKDAEIEYKFSEKVDCKYCGKAFVDKSQVAKHIRLKRCKNLYLESKYKKDIEETKEEIEKTSQKYILDLETRISAQQLTIDNLQMDIEKNKTYENIYKQYYSKNVQLLSENSDLRNKFALLTTENENLKQELINTKKKYDEYKVILEGISKNTNLLTKDDESKDDNNKEDNNHEDKITDEDKSKEEIPPLLSRISEIFKINGFLLEKKIDFTFLTKDILSYGIAGIGYFLIKNLYQSDGFNYYYDNKGKKQGYSIFNQNYLRYLSKNKSYLKSKSEKELKDILWLYIAELNKKIESEKYTEKYKPSCYILFDKQRNYYYYVRYVENMIDGHKYYSFELVRDIDGEYLINTWFPQIFEYIKELELPEKWIKYFTLYLNGKLEDKKEIIRDMKRRIVDDKYTYSLIKKALKD